MYKKICGIYSITNTVDNKRYIGQSINIKLRWRYHKSDLNCNNHVNIHLQRAWNKYGFDNFIFEILEECAPEELCEKEKYYITLYNAFGENGYNKTSGGEGLAGISHYQIWLYKYGKEEADKRMKNFKEKVSHNRKGKKASKSQKQKQSTFMKGKLTGKLNPNYGKKGKLNHKYGTHLTIETKNKISKGHIGKHLSLKHKFDTGYKLLRVTEEQIKIIFIKLLKNQSVCSISNELNVSRSTINKIKDYKNNIVFNIILQKLNLIKKDENYKIIYKE